MNREQVAKDILTYCKGKNTKFFTTKYAVGDIENSITGEKYTSRQLAVGIRLLNKLGVAKRVSNKRWQILAYDLTPYL